MNMAKIAEKSESEKSVSKEKFEKIFTYPRKKNRQ